MDYSKFTPRDNQNVKMEHTGLRTSEYSLWHRTLGKEYLMLDIDCVEYREGRGIVALIAVTGRCNNEAHIKNAKKFIWDRTNVERKILIALSQGINCPAYYVIHDNNLTVFHVHDLSEDLGKFQSMDRNQYAEFIKNL